MLCSLFTAAAPTLLQMLHQPVYQYPVLLALNLWTWPQILKLCTLGQQLVPDLWVHSIPLQLTIMALEFKVQILISSTLPQTAPVQAAGQVSNEDNSTTSSAKNRGQTLRIPSTSSSTPWLHLQILSINIVKIREKGSSAGHPQPLGATLT